MEADGCGIKEGYEKILETYMGLTAHFLFIKTYLEKRFAKTEDLKAVLYGLGLLSTAKYAFLQKCPASGAQIERSFPKIRTLLAKDRRFAEHNISQFILTLGNLEIDA